MKRTSLLWVLTTVAVSLGGAPARAEVLAEYSYSASNLNPNTQGWTWNGAGTVANGSTNLLMIESTGSPNFLFTKSLSSTIFQNPWSFTGINRFGGNGQEEYGLTMFVDDGTNLWHMSFRNAGNAFDGIYYGGDPDGPVGGVTAELIWPEDPNSPGPLDEFREWKLADVDGPGGNPPAVFLDGVDLLVLYTPAPSRFPAGTIGWGSLNNNESGFFQTSSMIFDGTIGVEPPPIPGDFNKNQIVDGADFLLWQRNLGAEDESVLNGGGDGMDGVDEGDLTLWKGEFGEGGMTIAAATPVPEPTSWSLSLLAVAALAQLASFRKR